MLIAISGVMYSVVRNMGRNHVSVRSRVKSEVRCFACRCRMVIMVVMLAKTMRMGVIFIATMM